MRIDHDWKWLSVYAHSPKGEGQWFGALQVFRKKWEFGIDCDWWEDGRDMHRSRYFLYAQKFDNRGLETNKWEFPRKNRWTHVTG